MSTETSRTTRTDSREADDLLFEGVLSLGVTLGEVADGGGMVFQFNEDRYRHTVVIGRTGSGKSNHLQQMEREDIRSGAGVAIIAAHEEDALYALSCVPEHRLSDVVLLDFSNPEFLPRMNPLDVDVLDRAAVDKAMSDVFELVTADCRPDWAGPRFEQMLRNGLGLILDAGYPFPRELRELNQIYTDPEHVKAALARCSDRHVYDQWTKVEPGARKSSDYGETVQWFLAKVERFSSDHVLAHVFGAGPSTVSVRDVVEGGKILVAYVPESRIGSAAARVIGKWLVMQLKDAIMNRRVGTKGSWQGLDYGLFEGASARGDTCGPEPFFVYVDEFARFATPDFATLLAEARKRNVGFVLGFQTLSQTRTLDMRTGLLGGVEEAILGNVGSVVCYPVGIRDAAIIAGQLDVEPDELMGIRRYQPLVRLVVDNQPTRPFALRVGLRPEPDNPSAARRVALSHVRDGVWVPVSGSADEGSFMREFGGDEDVSSPGGPRSHPEDPFAEDLAELALLPDDPQAHTRAPEHPTHPANGLGHAYRFCRKTSGILVTTRSVARAMHESGGSYQTIWVCYKDGRIDHEATRDEWERELEVRIGERVADGLTNAELDEFERLIDEGDDEAVETWLVEHRPDYFDIISRTNAEMNAAKVVDEG